MTAEHLSYSDTGSTDPQACCWRRVPKRPRNWRHGEREGVRGRQSQTLYWDLSRREDAQERGSGGGDESSHSLCRQLRPQPALTSSPERLILSWSAAWWLLWRRLRLVSNIWERKNENIWLASRKHSKKTQIILLIGVIKSWPNMLSQFWI